MNCPEGTSARSPFIPQQQTFDVAVRTAEKCQAQTSISARTRPISGFGSKHIVRSHGTTDALERKFPTGSTVTASSITITTLGLIRILPGLASLQNPRGDIGYRADGRMVEAFLETYRAKHGKTVCDTDTEALPPRACAGRLTPPAALSKLQTLHIFSEIIDWRDRCSSGLLPCCCSPASRKF
jgi:hypothetical protein